MCAEYDGRPVDCGVCEVVFGRIDAVPVLVVGWVNVETGLTLYNGWPNLAVIAA